MTHVNCGKYSLFPGIPIGWIVFKVSKICLSFCFMRHLKTVNSTEKIKKYYKEIISILLWSLLCQYFILEFWRWSPMSHVCGFYFCTWNNLSLYWLNAISKGVYSHSQNWPVFVIEQQVQQELQIIVIVFILCLVADSGPDSEPHK